MTRPERSIESRLGELIGEREAYELISLAQPLNEQIPAHPVHGSVTLRVERPFPQMEPPGNGIAVTHLQMGAHVGTHVDAPRHFLPDGPAIDELPVERFVRPAVTVALPSQGAAPIDAAALEPGLAGMRPGDFVLISTGYAAHFATPAYEDHPFLAEDAARLLVDRRAGGLGMDVPTPDAPLHGRPPDFDWPVHRALLHNDVLIFENLGPALERLVGRRVLVSAQPLPIDNGDGSPVAPVAFLPRLADG